MTAYRGKLFSGHPDLGTAVHAASFIRQRRIVLEWELLANPILLPVILIHELFHFVWPRLPNGLRSSYADLLEWEFHRRARGEVGESSSVCKAAFAAGSICWKEYVCESFCDTAAWLYSGVERPSNIVDHPSDVQLAQRWRKSRSDWFEHRFERYWELRYS